MNKQIQISDEQLSRLISGDQHCFEKVYCCYKDRIYYYALKLTKSEELAEEVVQDVFIKIWTNREKIDTQYSFSSFVFRVAHNHAINILKRIAYEKVAKERISKTAISSVNDTEDNVIYKEYMEIMADAIEQLPPKRKSIFNLSRTRGISHDDIAYGMGISKNTVKSQLVKATKSIRTYFTLHSGIAV